jgi:hypothetical protein
MQCDHSTRRADFRLAGILYRKAHSHPDRLENFRIHQVGEEVHHSLEVGFARTRASSPFEPPICVVHFSDWGLALAIQLDMQTFGWLGVFTGKHTHILGPNFLAELEECMTYIPMV